jgi:hypothetical protein
VKNLLLLLALVCISLHAKAQAVKSDYASESGFKEYLSKHQGAIDDIEGIWNVSTKQYYYRYDTLQDVVEAKKAARVAIISKDGKYQAYIITGEWYSVEFTKTDVAGVYFYRNYFKETNEFSKTSAVISKHGQMKYEYEIPEKLARLRMEDVYQDGMHVTNEVTWMKVFPEDGNKK